MKASMASYQSIALDLAKRIMNEEFPVGSKISGRTVLASQYSVSPETIRKAIAILKEANIVSVSQGKEIIVLSSQQACYYVRHHEEMVSAYSLSQELEALMIEKEENDKQFRKIVGEIMRYSDRLKNLSPYNPVDIRVANHSFVIGKPLQDLRMWQNTGATIVAVRRGTEIIVSPGPHAVLQADDRIVVVGAGDVWQKVTNFINKGN
ncbi:TrkA C-terminal domain-containing protein [Propionispora vibrioides]|uniref:Regulatory protein, gntR family n=1 Tax=Propionispora vibrioides TaxID=112903 RepID=A0A1H8V3X3_9FIRM|nr:TrkA C-terminal domain-containing protein [Propionispora vibrioides]SEP10091.1 regulatory protein, gntR family [Propionispora vibrioides]